MALPSTLTHLKALLPDILPHAPELPEPLLTYQARRAAIDFCKVTRCWRHLATVVMAAQDQEIIVAPLTATISEIEKASFSSTAYPDYIPLSADQFSNAELPSDPTEYGPPSCITQVQPNTVRVLPYAEGTLTLSLLLCPGEGRNFVLQDDGTVHDEFDSVAAHVFDQHREALVSGALQRILSQPGKPYSNPQMAAYHAQMYREARDQAFGVGRRGQQRAPRRAKSRFL